MRPRSSRNSPGGFVGRLPGLDLPPVESAGRFAPGAPAGHLASRGHWARALEPLRPARAVEYRPWFVESLLNENPNPNLPFHWTINPYRGCEFGCGYCFARYTHNFLELRAPEDFERRIYVKLRAGEILRETLRPGMLRDRPVAVGTATDPYQPAEGRFGITRAILETLSECPDLQLSITTKSPLVLRDLDLLLRISRRRPLRVNITLTTLNLSLARILEGRSPSPRRRLETIRRLADAGVPVSVFVMPVMLGITDHPEDLFRLLRLAREAGAQEAHGGFLHLEAPTRRTFFPILQRHFPHLWEEYQRIYSGGRLAPPEVRRLIRQRFAAQRVRAGFSEQLPPRVYEPMAGEQLTMSACEPVSCWPGSSRPQPAGGPHRD